MKTPLCASCVLFEEDNQYEMDESTKKDAQRTGQCTLYPQWTPVNADHFCGQFVNLYARRVSADMWNDEWRREQAARAAKNKDDNKRLRETNKALRAKLKEKTK